MLNHAAGDRFTKLSAPLHDARVTPRKRTINGSLLQIPLWRQHVNQESAMRLQDSVGVHRKIA